MRDTNTLECSKPRIAPQNSALERRRRLARIQPGAHAAGCAGGSPACRWERGRRARMPLGARASRPRAAGCAGIWVRRRRTRMRLGAQASRPRAAGCAGIWVRRRLARMPPGAQTLGAQTLTRAGRSRSVANSVGGAAPLLPPIHLPTIVPSLISCATLTSSAIIVP